MHEGAVLEMKKKKTTSEKLQDELEPITTKKETRRAIRAAVNQANKTNQEMEKYRDADRLGSIVH